MKLFLFASLLFCSFLVGGLQQYLYDTNHHPTPALLELLEVLHIPHDGTLASINSSMQKHLLVNGIEDWLMPDSPSYNRETIVTLLTKLGLFTTVTPSTTSYDGAIILGGSLWSMRQRIAYMINLWNTGYRFKKITIMTGENSVYRGRYTCYDLFEYTSADLPLNPHWQPWQIWPETEADMARMIWEQIQLPQALQSIPCEIIVSKIDSITGKRPTTGDNAKDFLKTNPAPGTYLIFSNQPFVGYQHAVFASYMPHDIIVETVGKRAFGDHNITMYLDRLAKWLYQELTPYTQPCIQ